MGQVVNQIYRQLQVTNQRFSWDKVKNYLPDIILAEVLTSFGVWILIHFLN